MNPRLRIQIDGEAQVVTRGESLIVALRRLGKKLPDLCHHPRLEGPRNCGLCTVRVDGELRSACAVAVTPGLRVEVEPGASRRREALEVVAKAHPATCPTCPAAGDCALQDAILEAEVDQGALLASESPDSSLEGRALGSDLWLHEARCTGCGLCAALAGEVFGETGLVMESAADGLKRPRASSGLDGLRHYRDNLIAVCPTSALVPQKSQEKQASASTSRRPRPLSGLRPWRRQPLRTTCPGCATGCAIDVDVPAERGGFSDVVFAASPRARDEEEVNAGWLCDRASFVLEEGRGLAAPQAAVDGQPVGRSAALARAGELLRRAHQRGEGRVLLVVSYDTSNEEAWLLRRFLHEVLGETQLLLLPARPEGEADDFLRDADHHSNRRGTLFLLGDAVAADPLVAAGGAELVLTFGFDSRHATRPWAAVEPELLTALDAIPARIALSAMRGQPEVPPAVFLPLRAGSLSTGTRVNRQARLQVFAELPTRAAAETTGLSTLHALAGALGVGLGPARSAVEVFAEIMRFHPRFAGLEASRVASLSRDLFDAESGAGGFA